MELAQNIKDRIVYVSKFIGELTTDWLLIKRELINAFSSEDRNLFSKRHPGTKKQLVNEFDLSVMDYWEEITGKYPILEKHKIHDPNWIYKPKGWGLQKLNEERKKNAKRQIENID